MNIRYTRLISEEVVSFNYLKWARSKIPVAFLRQQTVLVSLVIASTVLFILTTLFTCDVKHNSVHRVSELRFGVIVDCGSSGTRAHIFQWSQEDNQIERIELLRNQLDGAPLSKHITPGLSSIRDEPDKASEYMEPIMNFITDSIPSNKHLETPIYFLATAGLRLLDETIQKRILTDITRDLKVKFGFPRIRGQVITGEYEAIYSWLSLNMRKVYNTSDQSRSYGMIEMGGASTQVAFELKPDVENDILRGLISNYDAITAFRNEQISLNMGPNNSVKLFATTFLGLGVNSARESAVDLLVREYLNTTNQLGKKPKDMSSFEVRILDPCLTIGSSEVLIRPSKLITSTHQSIGFVTGQQSEAFRVKLQGSGNFINCLILLEKVLKIAKVERLNCSPSRQTCSTALLGTNFIPYQHHTFIGLSEMFFTTNEMIHLAGQFNRTMVLRETNRICSTEYNKLLEVFSHGGVSFEDRILYECFKASWLLTLLHHSGLNMPVTHADFLTADRIDGQEIDWTIGAMLSKIALDKRSVN